MQLLVVLAKLIDSILLELILTRQFFSLVSHFFDRASISFFIFVFNTLAHLQQLLVRSQRIGIDLILKEHDFGLELENCVLVLEHDVGHLIL